MTHLRCLSSWLAVAGLLVAFARPAALSTAQSTPAPDRFEQWLAAIDAHTPGDPGMAAVGVSTWAGSELEAVVAEAKRRARSMARTDPAGANEILLRGAVMHADIGRLIPDDAVRRSPSQQTTYIVRDGRWLGIRFISMHWQLGRTLLDSVLPDPAAVPQVREWYEETSVHLLRMRQFAAAFEHYARARQIFPADPEILFVSGVLHELFASANLQAAAESVVDSKRTSSAVSTVRSELTRAERFLRDSLVYRPDHLEARVRHGRILAELGRHEDASAELRRAIDDGAAGDLLYLALLFLGRAEEARGQMEAARAAFERAAMLFPNAQSPRLALSQISRRTGDRAAAQRELHVIAKLPDDQKKREDPWWAYYDLH